MSRPDPTIRRGMPRAAAGIPVPADRRFRRSDMAQGRRRSWRALLVRSAWMGGAGLGGLVVLAWIGHALLSLAALQVDHIQIQGRAWLSMEDVGARLDGLRGENILKVDLEEYRVRLLESSWVRSAELWRVLPSTVHVHIVERTPLAIARFRGQLYLVDAEGIIIDSYGPRYRDFDLPVVDGLMSETPGGPAVVPERIQLVERVFREVSARPELFRRLSQVDASDPRNAVVLLEGEPAELRLGDRDFLQRLQRYEETAPRLREQRQVVEYFDLRFGDRMWVK
ncbi:MAG TPA: FtsQ-type POTRA domain-containing protein [Vicinamibacterales bacterium]|nr:FtsQ-type POTRA domain-containing protein [Vicinamibacterales bacterium]